MNIGVVGYSGGKFDEDIAKALLAIALDVVEENHDAKEYTLVSGYSDMGIPALAYRMAEKRGWKTMGIACKQAFDNPLYDVDDFIIEGDEWGDESEKFLKNIDLLIRVGGGKQSLEETERAKNKNLPVYEFDLPEKK